MLPWRYSLAGIWVVIMVLVAMMVNYTLYISLPRSCQAYLVEFSCNWYEKAKVSRKMGFALQKCIRQPNTVKRTVHKVRESWDHQAVFTGCVSSVFGMFYFQPLPISAPCWCMTDEPRLFQSKGPARPSFMSASLAVWNTDQSPRGTLGIYNVI